MSKNLQHPKETTKTFNNKQTRAKTFNFQSKKKQKPSTSKRQHKSFQPFDKQEHKPPNKK
jgi:hypothetical protein